MKKPTYAAAALSMLLALGAPAGAQQIDYLAGNCANCHGTNGHSAGGIPGLAGLSSAYFVEQMTLFREGKRQATIMHQLVKGYSEAEVAALADFFSRQGPRTAGTAQTGAAR